MMLRHFDESHIESSLLSHPLTKEALEGSLKDSQKKAVDAINAKF